MDDGDFMITSIAEIETSTTTTTVDQNHHLNNHHGYNNETTSATNILMNLSDGNTDDNNHNQNLDDPNDNIIHQNDNDQRPLAKRNLYVMDKNHEIVPLASIHQILCDETLKHNYHGQKILELLQQDHEENYDGTIGGARLPDRYINEFTRIVCDYLVRLFSEYPICEQYDLFSRMIVEEFPRLGPEELWFWRADIKAGILKHTGKLCTRLENQRKPNTYKRRRLRNMGPDGQPLIEQFQPNRPTKVKLQFFNQQGQSIFIEGLSTPLSTTITESATETKKNKNRSQKNLSSSSMRNNNNFEASVTMSELQDDDDDETGADCGGFDDNYDDDDDDGNNDTIREQEMTNDNGKDKSNYHHRSSSTTATTTTTKNDNKNHQFRTNNNANNNNKSFEFHIKRPIRPSTNHPDDNENVDNDEDDDDNDGCCEKCGHQTKRKSSGQQQQQQKSKKKRNGGHNGFKIVVYCYPID
uniref:Uncharacterized protein DDB_G0286591-like n=1 Tax=Dermatophagoides pteronyssinus TaxID=6956 RepID=A0A6P6XT19_DERPT|nr:uncharacterized protein DDB_G0286591-like [Dermatophagoides pteronyssinus]